MTMINSHKNILITGGAKRVGREIAITFAKLGYNIAFTYNKSENESRSLLEKLQALGSSAIAIQVDFINPDAPQKVHEQVTRHFKSIHALINNASCFYPTPLKNITTDQIDHNYIVNARSPLMLSQLFSENLAQNYTPNIPESLGRIINFIDINILGQTLPNHIAYNASKAALHQITSSLAIELAPKITVNAIAPGVIAWADSYTTDQQKAYLNRVPLNRPGTPKDAAAAVKYLVCDAHYTTGQVLKLDGGRSII